MQNRYSKLSKDNKKKVRETFKDTKKGRELKPILDRLVIYFILLIVCFIVITSYIVINSKFKWYYILIDIFCLIFSIIFFVVQHRIRVQQYINVAHKFNIR